MNSRTLASIEIVAALGLLPGCSTTPPGAEKMRLLAQQTFGADAYLNAIWVPCSGPVSSALDTASSDTSDELAVADSILAAKTKRVDLVSHTNYVGFMSDASGPGR
jgi:hypothetical protein